MNTIETKCSIIIFNFRKVPRPGVLRLNQNSLTFEGYGIARNEFTQQFMLSRIEKVLLKKTFFKESIHILYENEWFKFTDFQDYEYKEIFRIINK